MCLIGGVDGTVIVFAAYLIASIALIISSFKISCGVLGDVDDD